MVEKLLGEGQRRVISFRILLHLGVSRLPQTRSPSACQVPTKSMLRADTSGELLDLHGEYEEDRIPANKPGSYLPIV